MMSDQSLIIRRVEAVLETVRALCIAAASCALVVLIVTFGWLVFGRYVLNVTPTWVEQLALLLICYIAFLGAAAGIQEDSHIGVTLFRDMLPDNPQKIILIIIDFILAAFGGIMLIAGVILMRFGWATLLPMLNVPESFRTLAITTCGGLIMVFAGTRGLFRILTFRVWSPQHAHKEF
jgi:TRAP-type C4-dicarboxylate transport system permease small subunit